MHDENIFSPYLQISAKEIDKELRKIAEAFQKQQETTFSEIGLLQKRFTNSWLGGKMLRGTLVKLGYELVNNKSSVAITKPACAFEILHTALLIHDDIIDQSLTRRGNPAFHVNKNTHYGISQGICFGDVGISLAGKLIAESDFPAERKSEALSYFFAMVNTTITGEMMDVAGALKSNRTDEQILQIHTMKTANYTIVGPLCLGAILAGASKEYIKKLALFGEPLGIAFQIQDDILGIFGKEEKLGKSTTSDIEENKSTLLITYALKHADKAQRKKVREIYGKKEITKKEQEIIKKIFIETSAFAHSQNIVAQLTSQAQKIIPSLSKNEMQQMLIAQFCDFLLERNL